MASVRASCPRASSWCRKRCGWWCPGRDMALRAVHGNRVEGLLGALLGRLPPADPFAPSTIVVGSHLVARWLTREIALARGIAAGLELVTFDAFLTQTWT